jgi:hypothetical protein
MNTTVTQFGHLEKLVQQTHARHEFFASADFKKDFHNYLEAQQFTVLSLDVFDTLLLRNDKSELTRFYELAGHLATFLQKQGGGITQPDVLIARLMAARTAYRSGDRVQGCREGALTDIYRLMFDILKLPEPLLADCIQIELQYESDNLTVNHALLDVVRQTVANGKRAILLSDMYLEGDHIQQLIEVKTKEANLFTHIISSADEKVSKHCAGKIYPHVEALMNTNSDNFLHIGDSLRSDYQHACYNGWQALHLGIPITERRARLNSHTQTVATLATHGLDVTQWIAPPK